MQLVLVVFIYLHLAPILGQDTVNLWPGEIRGKTITTRNGRDISAYLGIPYAEPPVGPLRFKPSKLKAGWDGVITGDTDANMCPQLNDDAEVVGDEDCLYLNVYTPDPNPKTEEELLPTMVFFHGGYFTRGSGNSEEAGPEYLLDKDIVLVTVNYRLGALGFLSTGDAEAPGNFGLKDQVTVLKWVERYIIAFGGSPAFVTIFGEGAGGASASLHALSDASSGLFHRYISQTGNAFNFWSYEEKENYKKYAMKLGAHVNCPTSDSKVLVDCLRNVDADKLVNSNEIFDDRGVPFFTWVPTEESEDAESAFIDNVPLHEILMRGAPKQPAIIGNVRDPGLLVTADFHVDGPMYNKISKNISEFVANATRVAFSSTESGIQTAQNFYFKDAGLDDKEDFIRNMTNFITDLGYRNPTELLTRVLHHEGEAPLFLYDFDYRGTYSKTSATIGSNKNIGVTNGDDLIYLFPQRSFDGKLSDNDERMIDIMTDFWTTFASTGTPTSNRVADPNSWKRYVDNERTTLRIGDSSDTTVQLFSDYDERLQIWNTILGQDLLDFLSLKQN